MPGTDAGTATVGSLMQGGQGNSTNNAANDAKHDSPAGRTQAMRHVRFACLGGGSET
jgi:hypothetical protein